jgi:hypothetical protein
MESTELTIMNNNHENATGDATFAGNGDIEHENVFSQKISKL